MTASRELSPRVRYSRGTAGTAGASATADLIRASTASRALTGLPPLTERLRRNRRQVAGACPGGERPRRRVDDPSVPRERALQRAAQALRALISLARRHRPPHRPQRPPLETRSLPRDHLGALVHEDRGDVDR